jgi:purine-binding chemotaxis protein CheW
VRPGLLVSGFVVTSEQHLSAQARCIAVRVGESLYGLPVEFVQEVIGMRPVTRVFHAPEALAGVTNLRGEVLPVLELGVMLGSVAETATADARIVVVRENGGQRRRAGLRVDELRGLRDLPEALAETPSTVNEQAREVILGVISDPPPCAVLNVLALFDSPLIASLSGRESAG